MRVFRGWIFVFFAGIVWTANGLGQDRSQTRSMVISRNGIVAAESPLAAQAGVRILEQGGNAVDAAIASNAMMGVVEPMMNGIGGDLFAIVYDAKANKLYGLNASARTKQLRRRICQKIARQESVKSFGIRTWPGRSGRLRSTGGMRFTKERSRKRFWSR